MEDGRLSFWILLFGITFGSCELHDLVCQAKVLVVYAWCYAISWIHFHFFVRPVESGNLNSTCLSIALLLSLIHTMCHLMPYVLIPSCVATTSDAVNMYSSANYLGLGSIRKSMQHELSSSIQRKGVTKKRLLDRQAYLYVLKRPVQQTFLFCFLKQLFVPRCTEYVS